MLDRRGLPRLRCRGSDAAASCCCLYSSAHDAPYTSLAAVDQLPDCFIFNECVASTEASTPLCRGYLILARTLCCHVMPALESRKLAQMTRPDGLSQSHNVIKHSTQLTSPLNTASADHRCARFAQLVLLDVARVMVTCHAAEQPVKTLSSTRATTAGGAARDQGEKRATVRAGTTGSADKCICGGSCAACLVSRRATHGVLVSIPRELHGAGVYEVHDAVPEARLTVRRPVLGQQQGTAEDRSRNMQSKTAKSTPSVLLRELGCNDPWTQPRSGHSGSSDHSWG